MSIFSRTDPKRSSPHSITDPELGEITFIPVKKMRSMRIYIKPFKGVIVKYPDRTSTKKVLGFIQTKRSWIKQALKRAKIIEKQSIDHHTRYEHIQKSEIRAALTDRLERLAKEYDFNYNKVSLRNQSSRWGSCSAQDNISLNRKLYFLPDHLRDYVLVHELAHTLQKNHGPGFWSILHNIFGEVETLEMRKALKAYDYLFYPPPN